MKVEALDAISVLSDRLPYILWPNYCFYVSLAKEMIHQIKIFLQISRTTLILRHAKIAQNFNVFKLFKTLIYRTQIMREERRKQL